MEELTSQSSRRLGSTGPRAVRGRDHGADHRADGPPFRLPGDLRTVVGPSARPRTSVVRLREPPNSLPYQPQLQTLAAAGVAVTMINMEVTAKVTSRRFTDSPPLSVYGQRPSRFLQTTGRVSRDCLARAVTEPEPCAHPAFAPRVETAQP